jgi:hypothetical protein
MLSEISPPGVRSKAVGVAISTNWLTNVRAVFIAHSAAYNPRQYHFISGASRMPSEAEILRRRCKLEYFMIFE